MTDDKLHALEIALTHQEEQIRDLSEMVEKQWKEIDRLKLRLDATLQKVTDIENASGKPMSTTDIAASEKPPHY